MGAGLVAQVVSTCLAGAMSQVQSPVLQKQKHPQNA
jgi:hypothetical protein